MVQVPPSELGTADCDLAFLLICARLQGLVQHGNPRVGQRERRADARSRRVRRGDLMDRLRAIFPNEPSLRASTAALSYTQAKTTGHTLRREARDVWRCGGVALGGDERNGAEAT